MPQMVGSRNLRALCKPCIHSRRANTANLRIAFLELLLVLVETIYEFVVLGMRWVGNIFGEVLLHEMLVGDALLTEDVVALW